MSIGRTIRILRALRGYSQEYLASQIGVSQKTLSRMENDRCKIDYVRLSDISKCLEIDTYTFLQLEEYLNSSRSKTNFLVHPKPLWSPNLQSLMDRIENLENQMNKSNNNLDIDPH